MPKPAPPDTPLSDMIDAVYFSKAALIAATRIDHRRTADDRTFFEEQARLLDPVIADLEPIEDAIRRHDRGVGTEAQATVVLGDAVLDATVRDGNRVTKAELARTSGLGAPHVFGARVDDLTGEKLALEPAAVLRAADRLADLPDFPSKGRVDGELRGAATRQEEAIDARTGAEGARARLISRGAAACVRASETLSKLEAALLDRFPRQYAYAGEFFLQRRPPRKKAKVAEDAT